MEASTFVSLAHTASRIFSLSPADQSQRPPSLAPLQLSKALVLANRKSTYSHLAYLHSDCPRWKKQHFTLEEGKTTSVAFFIANSKSVMTVSGVTLATPWRRASSFTARSTASYDSVVFEDSREYTRGTAIVRGSSSTPGAGLVTAPIMTNICVKMFGAVLKVPSNYQVLHLDRRLIFL